MLACAIARVWLWGWPTASSQLALWRGRADSIPDPILREQALQAIDLKRENVLGAALFSVLTKRREPGLVSLLVAYQTLWDYLDSLGEKIAVAELRSADRLQYALIDALDPNGPLADYYSGCPWELDGGYLQLLVAACRDACRTLPSYGQVKAILREGVEQCLLQDVNHLQDERERVEGLKAWATTRVVGQDRLNWFEMAAASSAYLPYPLLAMASETKCDVAEALRTNAAYFPWMALTITMLDSFTDLNHDRQTGQHSYVSYYDTKGIARERISEIVPRLMREMKGITGGRRHVLVAASMVAMYLSSEHHYESPPSVRAAKSIATSGGSFVSLLVPMARVWRRLDKRQHARRAGSRPGALPPQIPLSAPAQTALFWRAPFTYLTYCRRRYGPRFTLSTTSHPPLVFLSDPHDVRALISAPEDVLMPGEGGATVSPIVGERSFMLSDAEAHSLGRKATLSAFHQRAIEGYTEAVTDAAKRLLDSWPTGRPVAVHHGLRRLTLEILLRKLAGHTGDSLEGPVKQLHSAILDMLAVTASPAFVEPRLRHGPGQRIWRRFLDSRARVDELLDQLLIAPASGDDGVDLLTCLGSPPDGEHANSARRLRDNAMSLILAGHETTAAQLAWAFQLIAHHRPVRDRLVQEIDTESGDKYLTATIQEVLRHRCVFVFAIPRAVAKSIEIGGWTYAPPANLLACTYLLHHDPVTYPEPHAFRPERFLDTPPNPLTWIPWGGGRKRCPGLHLAMLEMKIVLRTVLRERRLFAAGSRMERPGWRSVIVAPHEGSRVVLAHRH